MASFFLHGSTTRFRRAGMALASVALASLAMACGKTTDATPRDVAMQLYVSLEAAGVRGMPEPRALLVIEPYLTDDLAARLRRASEQLAAHAGGTTATDASHSVFSSLYDGYTTYFVRDVLEQGDTARVIMAFTNTQQKPTVEWSDTLVVVKAAPSWRAHDLRYGSDWDFGYRGSLRSVLEHVLGEATTPADAATSPDETSATPPAPAANTR